MAGWSSTGNDVALDSIHGPDDGEKTTQTPAAITAGEATWWPDFAATVLQEYARWVKRHPECAVATVSLDADNGAGDTNGIGVLTLVLTTA